MNINRPRVLIIDVSNLNPQLENMDLRDIDGFILYITQNQTGPNRSLLWIQGNMKHMKLGCGSFQYISKLCSYPYC